MGIPLRPRRRERTVSPGYKCNANDTGPSSKDTAGSKNIRYVLLMILACVGFIASNAIVLPKKDTPLNDTSHSRQKAVLDLHPENQQSIESSAIHSKDLADDEDISWLNHIQLGEWLGTGDYSDTFEATIDNNPTDKEYIIKFTGDYDSEGEYADKSIAAIEAVRRLSPHPNVPQDLYFVANTPNPFQTEQFTLPVEHNEKGTSGIRGLNVERLLESRSMSITVSERVFQTQKHMKGNDLIIPANKVRCFFYHFFEMMHYAHTKGVIMIDTKLWNVVLENGEMKFLDWNRAEIFESKKERRMRKARNESAMFYMCRQGIDEDCDYVHQYDVGRVTLRLDEFLHADEKRRRKNLGNTISARDRELFKDMRNMMKYDEPRPSIRWILDHHDYFAVENSSNCTLVW